MSLMLSNRTKNKPKPCGPGGSSGSIFFPLFSVIDDHSSSFKALRAIRGSTGLKFEHM